MAGFIILTVSQLNSYVKSVIESDEKIRGVFIRGEISNCTVHRLSGHVYFTLKDTESAIKAVMFRGNAARIRFIPENGMSVIVQGDVSLYARDGSYQINVFDMQPDGVGAMYVALEQLKKKLSEEGIFDEEKKKAIPRMPQRIGIVTAKGSAALQDILNTLRRRYPCEVVIADVTVQGEGAAENIVRALKILDSADCDEIIVARGGGSAEDLWNFNDERVVRAIYGCTTPVISAIGHETDITLSDFAADLRAPTPTAAAELAAVEMTEINEKIFNLKNIMRKSVEYKLDEKRYELAAIEKVVDADEICKSIEKAEARSKELLTIAGKSIEKHIENKRKTLIDVMKRVDGLGPMKTLMRGYSVVSAGGNTVKSVRELEKGERIEILFSDGKTGARVE
ncbi:MAG: exodeoxyribonuclease VII large subunit [Oscillospiraceae bacterium]|nr:exodeoxyribonuclease VII large subunit [Oscillospiraceae bacterium]